MAVFPKLEVEDVVQVGDQTRLNASKSFISKGAGEIVKVEIKPGALEDYVDVTGSDSKDWHLDWVYSALEDFDALVSVRLTYDAGSGEETEETLGSIKVLTEDSDALFSVDSELIPYEPDILRWVPQGRSSFLNIHRQAQRNILAWLDEQGYTDTKGDRLTKEAVVDREEVRYWSAAETLRLIFLGISNSVEDVFFVKARHYDSVARSHRDRAILRLDRNGDGELSPGEGVNMKSLSFNRR
jgi:hypothetical protein